MRERVALSKVSGTLSSAKAEPQVILGEQGGYRTTAGRPEGRLCSCIVAGASTRSGLLRIRPAARSTHGLFETSREGSEKTVNAAALAEPDSAPQSGRDQSNDHPAAGRFAEFFAGIGLVREAIEPLGWQCVFANDIAPRKEEMYRRRFGGEHFRLGDIHELGIGDLPAGLDLVTASFPCIDLSLAGNRAGLAGRHSGTIWPFLDIVTALCIRRTPPSAVLLENVTGFLTSRGGDDLAHVCRRLAAVDYVIDLLVVDARWFRPQSRPRLFVTAQQRERGGEPWRPSDSRPSRVRPAAVRRFEAAHPELPFVDLRLPVPPARALAPLVSVLDDLPPGDARWWPEGRTTALVAEMAPQNRRRVDELLAGERDGVATMYRRRRNGRTVGELRPDRLAGCLRTPQGGSSVQFLVDCRSGAPRIRPLTGREYARLQGADSFPIEVNDRQARLGFGDAVCVQAVRWLVQHAFDAERSAALDAPASSRATAPIQFPYAPPTSGRDEPQQPLFK